MSHADTTTLGVSLLEDARITSTMDDEQIRQLEAALERYLREEVGELRSCSLAQWLQVGGPAVRPSMVVRSHGIDRRRVFWAGLSGELYDLILSEDAARDLSWIVLQHLPTGITAAGTTGVAIDMISTGRGDKVLFAAVYSSTAAAEL